MNLSNSYPPNTRRELDVPTSSLSSHLTSERTRVTVAQSVARNRHPRSQFLLPLAKLSQHLLSLRRILL